MSDTALVHASCVSIDGAGILLIGPPGAGKSDLVLRLLDQPGAGTSGHVRSAQLVADDQVAIRRDGDDLVGSAPAPLAGKLEVRGLGIVAVPAVPEARLALAVQLVAASQIERMPEHGENHHDLLGRRLPLILIDPEKPSAPARIRAALDQSEAG